VLHTEPELAGCPAPLRAVIEGCLVKDAAARPSPAQLIESCRDRAAVKTVEFSESWLPPALAAELTSHAAAAPEPVAPEPVAPEPVAPAPVVPAPAAAEPVVAEPVVAEPVVPAPAAAEPVVAEPVVAEPVAPAPAAPLLAAAGLAAAAEAERADGGRPAGQVDSGDGPTLARTLLHAVGHPKDGWRDLPRTTVIAATAAALLLAVLIGYGAFTLAEPGGSRHPAAGGGSPGPGARRANGHGAPASPSPSPSSSLDPCLFGNWTYVTEDIVSTINGASVIYTGGAGVTQSFQPDGITTLSEGDHGVYTTTYDGTGYTAINRGVATMHYQTQNGMLLLSEVSEHGTQEVTDNGVVASSGPLTMNTEPERYACSANTLRLYALNGSSVEETRDESGS
jgi:hypothetical protein